MLMSNIIHESILVYHSKAERRLQLTENLLKEKGDGECEGKAEVKSKGQA